MKRLFCVLILSFAAHSAAAGVAYQFVSETSGMTRQKLAGQVVVEGPRMRVDFSAGDGMLFSAGSRVVSGDGGQTLTVLDPQAKTFYTIDLGSILGGSNSMLRQMGDLVRLDVRNPKASVRDRGRGPTIEGYPTRKSAVASSYEMLIDALGQKMTMTMNSATDVWWTDRLGAELTNFLQARGVRTGIDAVDKILALQTTSIQGFPLRQVTTTRIVMNGKTMTSTTTSNVSSIRQVTASPAEFAIPPGYKKVPSPMEKFGGR